MDKETEMTYPTLSLNDESAAYRAIKERFGLKAKQRDLLDRHPTLGQILLDAHAGRWADVAYVLRVDGITS
jgi:hypothetical protein